MIGYLRGIYISLIILSWSILSYSYDWHNNFTVSTVICTSKTCYNFEKLITQNMNRNADPCTDFYEFVCGRYKNPLPYYYPAWSIPVEMAMKSAKDTKRILEKPPSVNDSAGLKKAKNLYKACVEKSYLGMINGSTAYNYIQDSAYFPLYSDSISGSQRRKSWVQIHNYYLRLTGESGLFEIFPTGFSSSNYEPLLHLTSVYSPFGRILFKKLLQGSKRDLYEKYLKAVLFTVFSYSLLKIYPKVLTERIHNIVKFRCEIQAIKNKHQRFSHEPAHNEIMTVSELESWYSTLAATEKTDTIPWVETISSLYNNKKSEEDVKKMRITLTNKLYHQSLMHLIRKTPSDVIVNHIHLYFIEKHLEFNNLLNGILMETILVNGKLEGTVLYLGKRWHTCILSNPLPEAIGRAYIQNYFSPDKKKEIKKYVEEIKDVLVLQIQDSKWLDPYLMDKFKNIIDDMKIAIGYPEFYDSEHLRPGYSPDINPTNFEAFYCSNVNRLSISAAVFQPPLYDSSLPKTVVYGAAGMLISHELHHAFGPQAVRQCYSFSFPPSKKFLYEERVDCFHKKYNKLPVKELKFLNPVPTIDGSRTLNENIADAMGLKLAYEAFRKDGWENSQCSTLPMYRSITCEQLFFIAFGSVFCSDIQADVMLEEVMTEEYSTPRIRVNEAVANMKEFSKAFDCPKKAVLNPLNKCDLWK